ncbi:MAG: terminase small subunit [Oscillospiraceae bacterium]|nr:terminase small subunit [Oscillospiraceae bacterium]
MALTPKQARFVQEYLVDLNATAAAKRAGYNPKTAYSIGQENLKKPEIQSAIQQAKKARRERTEVTQDYVIEKLKEIADKQASDGAYSELKYANKLKALELLGKHVGAFERKNAGGDGALMDLLKGLQDG